MERTVVKGGKCLRSTCPPGLVVECCLDSDDRTISLFVRTVCLGCVDATELLVGKILIRLTAFLFG